MKKDHSSGIILLLIVLAGLAVRVPMLGYSFYGDEGFTVVRDTNQFITDSEDRFRPIFFSLVYLWKQLGFHGEVGLRLLPLLFGLLQIPVAFIIGKKLGGRSLALAFSVLIAASPMLIEFSQELRMYSLIALIGLLQVWVLLELLEAETLQLWLLFVVVAVLGVYTHLHYWLFLAGMAMTFVRERQVLAWWKGFAALAATAGIYALNYGNLAEFIARRGGEYAVDSVSALPKLLAAFTVGFNYFDLPEQGMGRAVGVKDVLLNLPLAVLAAIPAVIILWRIIWLHTREEKPRALFLSHELFTIPVLLALAASLITHKYWVQPKYLIFAAPFALLFIAQAYLAIERIPLRKMTVILSLAVLVIALVHFWQPDEYGRRENWRLAAHILREDLNGESALLLLPGSYRLLEYYAPEVEQKALVVRPPQAATKAGEFEQDVEAKLLGKREVYYLRHDVVQNLRDPRDLLPMALDNLGTRATVIRLNPRFQLMRWNLQ